MYTLQWREGGEEREEIIYLIHRHVFVQTSVEREEIGEGGGLLLPLDLMDLVTCYKYFSPLSSSYSYPFVLSEVYTSKRECTPMREPLDHHHFPTHSIAVENIHSRHLQRRGEMRRERREERYR